jgi:two-component system sensor histidine kinase MprB
VSFRRRLVLLAAAAVAVAVVLAGAVTYVVVRHQLRAGVDDRLRGLVPRVTFIRGQAPLDQQPSRIAIPPGALGAASGVAQAVTAAGDVIKPPDVGALPADARAREVAAGTRPAFFRDAVVDDTHVRILTTRGLADDALMVATPLTDVDDALARLRWILVAVALGGVGVAAGLGLLVARATAGDDELARLAGAFNAMLAALERSREAQRQLVADASHELRTPLTAVRANIELLERERALPRGERQAVLAGARGQLQELTVLVGDLVDLARPGEQIVDTPEELRLDGLVRGAVERARSHAPGLLFVVETEPCVVCGSRARLHRAVANLLDNAVKWSPAGACVEVGVTGRGTVTVRDHGPGIADSDVPHVFDRFYRAPAARGLPGSGLGLAIVRQVAEAHGGRVTAERAEGGGTRLRLDLPLASPTS